MLNGAQVEVFDMEEESWSRKVSSAVHVHGYDHVASAGSCIYLCKGRRHCLHQLNTSTEMWSQLSKTPVNVGQHGVVGMVCFQERLILFEKHLWASQGLVIVTFNIQEGTL